MAPPAPEARELRAACCGAARGGDAGGDASALRSLALARPPTPWPLAASLTVRCRRGASTSSGCGAPADRPRLRSVDPEAPPEATDTAAGLPPAPCRHKPELSRLDEAAPPSAPGVDSEPALRVRLPGIVVSTAGGCGAAGVAGAGVRQRRRPRARAFRGVSRTRICTAPRTQSPEQIWRSADPSTGRCAKRP